MTDTPDYVTAEELEEAEGYFVDVFALKACEPLGMTMEDAVEHLDRSYEEAMDVDGARLHATVRDGAFPAEYADTFAADAAERFVQVLYGVGDGGDPAQEQVDRYTDLFTDLLEP